MKVEKNGETDYIYDRENDWKYKVPVNFDSAKNYIWGKLYQYYIDHDHKLDFDRTGDINFIKTEIMKMIEYPENGLYVKHGGYNDDYYKDVKHRTYEIIDEMPPEILLEFCYRKRHTWECLDFFDRPEPGQDTMYLEMDQPPVTDEEIKKLEERFARREEYEKEHDSRKKNK